MSKQQLILTVMSLLAFSFAARHRKQTEDALSFFAAQFPDDAHTLVIEAQYEVEVAQ